MTKPYTARNGAQQLKPSFNDLMFMQANDEGFCLACGETAYSVEPDARKYKCAACGALKVYGAQELLLMNLYHD